jgi:hypothetical protein
MPFGPRVLAAHFVRNRAWIGWFSTVQGMAEQRRCELPGMAIAIGIKKGF